MGAVAGAIAGPLLGSVAGGLISSNASSNAANTQATGATNAAQIAANSQLQGLQFVQGQEQPYNQAGQLALGQYEGLLGLGGQGGGPRALSGPTAGVGGGGSGGMQQNLSNFLTNLPGYQFEQQQGMNAIQNSAASRGQALSGNTLQGLEQFGQGLASTQFQQYMQQLAGLTGVGQAAASGVATAGGNLIPGAGASLASGVNAGAGYNAANIAQQGNIWGGVFNSPSVQSGLGSIFSGLGQTQAPIFNADTSGLPSSGQYALNNYLTS